MTNGEEMRSVRRSLTLAEVGVIVAILTSLSSLIFTLGVVYGQVRRNSADIAEVKPKVDDMRLRIERIDGNVDFLTTLAREERERNRK